MTTWKIEKTIDGENEIITITRPINDKPKSTACVSRTVKAGTVARVKYARFNDDFPWNPVKWSNSLTAFLTLKKSKRHCTTLNRVPNGKFWTFSPKRKILWAFLEKYSTPLPFLLSARSLNSKF